MASERLAGGGVCVGLQVSLHFGLGTPMLTFCSMTLSWEFLSVLLVALLYALSASTPVPRTPIRLSDTALETMLKEAVMRLEAACRYSVDTQHPSLEIRFYLMNRFSVDGSEWLALTKSKTAAREIDRMVTRAHHGNSLAASPRAERSRRSKNGCACAVYC
jgi:hypothetical protein